MINLCIRVLCTGEEDTEQPKTLIRTAVVFRLSGLHEQFNSMYSAVHYKYWGDECPPETAGRAFHMKWMALLAEASVLTQSVWMRDHKLTWCLQFALPQSSHLCPNWIFLAPVTDKTTFTHSKGKLTTSPTPESCEAILLSSLSKMIDNVSLLAYQNTDTIH